MNTKPELGTNRLTDGESISLIQEAVDNGVTFMDNAWEYNGAGNLWPNH